MNRMMWLRSARRTCCGVILIGLLAVGGAAARGQDEAEIEPIAPPAPPPLFPLPAETKWAEGSLRFFPRATLGVMNGDDETRAVAKYFQETVRTAHRALMEMRDVEVLPTNAIVLHRVPATEIPGEEAYEINVTGTTLEVKASTGRGMFYGVQTVRQILDYVGLNQSPKARPDVKSRKIRTGVIRDNPRYRWRGLMLDCSRHFIKKDFIKHYIDLMAYHKLNVLHWHLTDDQGWRIEIKKYPKLTEIGAWRGEGDNRYGGFYTQDDIRDVLAYAKSRYVTVIPEIDLPGHCEALLAAYPELSCTGGPFTVNEQWGVHDAVLCAGSPKAAEFVNDVLTEVSALFPGEYVHIGGENAVSKHWASCPQCQARMKAEGLTDVAQLRAVFARGVEKTLTAHGKRAIGWEDLGGDGLSERALIQITKDSAAIASVARTGHDVISSLHTACFFDAAHGDFPGEPKDTGVVPIERVLAFDPAAGLSDDAAKCILGVEACLWTEQVPSESEVGRRLFPRLAALAEVAWTPVPRREEKDAAERLQAHLGRLRRLGVPYFSTQPTSTPTTVPAADGAP